MTVVKREGGCDWGREWMDVTVRDGCDCGEERSGCDFGEERGWV